MKLRSNKKEHELRVFLFNKYLAISQFHEASFIKQFDDEYHRTSIICGPHSGIILVGCGDLSEASHGNL